VGDVLGGPDDLSPLGWVGQELPEAHSDFPEKAKYVCIYYCISDYVYILLYLSSRLSLPPLAWLHLILLVLPLPRLAARTPQLMLFSSL